MRESSLARLGAEPLALALLALLVLGAVLLEARDWIIKKRELVLEQSFASLSLPAPLAGARLVPEAFLDKT